MDRISYIFGKYPDYRCTCGCECSILQVEINKDFDVIILICEEITTVLIIDIRGISLELLDIYQCIALDTEIKSNLRVLYPEPDMKFEYYTDTLFNEIRESYKNMMFKALASLPFNKSIIYHIAKYLRPTWYDFDMKDEHRAMMKIYGHISFYDHDYTIRRPLEHSLSV